MLNDTQEVVTSTFAPGPLEPLLLLGPAPRPPRRRGGQWPGSNTCSAFCFGQAGEGWARQPKFAPSRMRREGLSFTCMCGEGDPADRCTFGLCHKKFWSKPGEPEPLSSETRAGNRFPESGYPPVKGGVNGSAVGITRPFYWKINGTSLARTLVLGKGSFTS